MAATPSRLERMETMLAAIQGDVSTVAVDVALIKDRQAADRERLEAHQLTLYGNGHEGLVTTVAQLREEMSRIIALGTAALIVLVSTALGAFIWLVVTHPTAVTH